jgi:hypothetical protein
MSRRIADIKQAAQSTSDAPRRRRAEARIAEREVRGYEAEYVNALWHWDCHHGSRKVLTRRGEWVPSAISRTPLVKPRSSAIS